MQITTNSLRGHLIGFFAIALVLPLYLLLLSGFPTIAAVKVCAMILVQITAGGLIWLTVSKPSQICVTETVGIGFAIGSIFTVIGHQLTLGRDLESIGWALPVVIAFAVSLIFRRDLPKMTQLSKVDMVSFLFVPFSVAATFTQWWWLLPLLIPIVLVIYLVSNQGYQKFEFSITKHLAFVLLLMIPITFAVVYLRQLNLEWWIRSWDVTYFESKSHSIAKFGPSKNISLLGYPLNYHWFGIAWIGTISVAMGLPSWLAVTQVAPVYSAISIACIFWAIGKRVGKKNIYPFAITLTFAFASPSLSPANPPNIISMIWALAASLVAYEFFLNQKMKLFVIFSVFSIAALSGKVSAGFVILGAFTFTDVVKTLGQKTSVLRCIARNFLLAISAVLAFYLIIGGPNRLGNNTFKLSFRGPGYFFGVDPGRNPIIFYLGTIATWLTLFQIVLISIICLIFKIGHKNYSIFCLGAFIAGFIPFNFAEDDGMAYFVANAVNFAALGAGFLLVSSIEKLHREVKFSKLQLICALLLSLVIAKSWQTLYRINWREVSFVKGGPTPILLLIVVSSIVSYWILSLTILKFSNKNYDKISFKSKVITFAVVLVFANSLPNAFNVLRNVPKQTKSISSVPFVGSDNIKFASTWIKSNLQSDALLATNRFCVEERVNFCIDPRFFVVSATSQRQILIEGPSRSVGYGGNEFELYPKWAKDRLDLSRGFADRPTAEITARLNELGVGWFYLFKENTKNGNWEPYGTVKYENTEIAIIKLNDK